MENLVWRFVRFVHRHQSAAIVMQLMVCQRYVTISKKAATGAHDMVTFGQLKQAIDTDSKATVTIQLPNEELLAAHFHITEIGKVEKTFVDCGGVQRTNAACVLQTYVANDIDHRLSVATLKAIVGAADQLDISDELGVELEVQQDTIAIYAVDAITQESGHLNFQLGGKATACLAPDSCGIEVVSLDLGKMAH